MAVNDLLRSLEQSRFFGTVELKHEAGRVVLRKTETMKPPTDDRNNRVEADEHDSPR
jgi:hypothetical protein